MSGHNYKNARGALIAALFAAAVAAAAAAPATASGATITVNSAGDAMPTSQECSGITGDCSLRQALDKANPSGDTIAIPTSVSTIKLTNGTLTVAKNVTIAGTGAARTTIDGQSAVGLFGISPGLTVTISGLTLTHGSSGSGAAVRMAADHVTLSGDKFIGNTSGGSGGKGFGVVTASGAAATTLTITGCSFTGNHVGGGPAGIGFGVINFSVAASNSSLTFSNSTMTGNTIGGNGATGNGAMDYAATGAGDHLTVSGSTFAANHVGSGKGAIGNGGAIDAAGTTSITNSRFIANTAGGNGTAGFNSGVGTGGAIDVKLASGQTFALTGSTVAGNRAGGTGSSGQDAGNGFGGGVEVAYAANATVTFAGDTVSGNTAGGSQGISFDNGAGRGAGIDLSGTNSTDRVTIVDSTITGNIASPTSKGNSNAVGGGLRIGLGPATLVNDTIDANSTGSLGAGGGIQAVGPNDRAVTVKNTIMAANVAGATSGNCGSRLASKGHNLTDEDPLACGFGARTDDSLGKPHLGRLANNGGPTLTQKLLSGPGIDGGTNVGCPTTDQRGVKRPQGRACDIGAYELAPPKAITRAAGAIETTSATLRGTTANPDLLAGKASFQYGRTARYGATTKGQPLAAMAGAAPLSAPIAGLKPGTRYHYRIVVTNPDGTRTGRDRTFKTSAARPKLSRLKIKPSTFTVGQGTTISFRDSKAATTTFTVLRRGGSGAYKKLGSFTRKSKVGANAFHFTPKLGGHTLSPGTYRLQAVARRGAQRSKPVRAGFRIKS